jgi:hypothetical protein
MLAIDATSGQVIAARRYSSAVSSAPVTVRRSVSADATAAWTAGSAGSSPRSRMTSHLTDGCPGARRATTRAPARPFSQTRWSTTRAQVTRSLATSGRSQGKASRNTIGAATAGVRLVRGQDVLLVAPAGLVHLFPPESCPGPPVLVVQRTVGGHRQAAVGSPGDGQQALTGLEGRVRPRLGTGGETAAVVLLPGLQPSGNAAVSPRAPTFFGLRHCRPARRAQGGGGNPPGVLAGTPVWPKQRQPSPAAGCGTAMTPGHRTGGLQDAGSR